jgi:hypothetical protein
MLQNRRLKMMASYQRMDNIRISVPHLSVCQHEEGVLQVAEPDVDGAVNLRRFLQRRFPVLEKEKLRLAVYEGFKNERAEFFDRLFANQLTILPRSIIPPARRALRLPI